MARMPDIEAEIRRDWERARDLVTEAGGWFTPHKFVHDAECCPPASQAPAVMPVTVGITTAKENRMSLASDLHALAARLEPLGEEAITKLEAVAANPATADVFAVLHQLTGIPGLDPTVISEVAAGLKTVVRIYAPQAA